MPQKGVGHALDYIRDYLHSLATGIAHRLHYGWGHSYPADHCHYHVDRPSYSRKKVLQLFGCLPTKMKHLENRMVCMSGKIVPKLVHKISCKE